MAIYRIKRFSSDNDSEELAAEFYDLARSKKERDKRVVNRDALRGAISGGIGGAIGGAAAGRDTWFGTRRGAMLGASGGILLGSALGTGIGLYNRHKRNKNLRDLKDTFQTASPEMRKKLLTRLKEELSDDEMREDYD